MQNTKSQTTNRLGLNGFWLMAALAVSMLFSSSSFGQATCNASVQLSAGGYLLSDSTSATYWVNLGTGYNELRLHIGLVDVEGCMSQSTFTIYSGNCSSLQLVQSETLNGCDDTYIIDVGITSSQSNYYLKIDKPNVSKAVFVQALAQPCACINLPSNNCELVCNGGFEDYSFTTGGTPPYPLVSAACPFEIGANTTSDLVHQSLPIEPHWAGQSAYLGNGFASGLASTTSNEYIESPLLAPIANQEIVFVEFFAKLNNNASHFPYHVGLRFESNQVPPPAAINMITNQAEIYSPTHSITDQSWSAVGGFVQNTSGQAWNYAYLGDFWDEGVFWSLSNIGNGGIYPTRVMYDELSIIKMPNAGADITVCPNETFTLGSYNCTLPAGVQVSWSLGSTQLGNQVTQTHSQASIGTYVYTMTLTYNGNTITDDVIVTVQNSVNTNIAVSSSTPLPSAVCQDNTYSFDVLNPTTGWTYTWFDQAGNQLGTGSALSLTLGINSPPQITGIQVYATNGNCSSWSNIISINYCCDIPGITHIFGGSTSSLGGNWNNTTVIVHGTLQVDNNFTINNSQVYLDANSEIYVVGGNSLSIDNSVLEACGNHLWSQVAAGTNTTLSVNNSTFKEAYSALNISSDCNFSITGANTFTENYIGILLQGTSNAAIIDNCTFNCPNNLLNPYPNRKGESGIQILGSSAANTVGSNAPNSFSDLKNGVYATLLTKSLIVESNNFTNISYSAPNFLKGAMAAVEIEDIVSASWVLNNDFDYCAYAIRDRKTSQLQFTGNSVDYIAKSAVYISNNLNSLKNISGNFFSFVPKGVTVVDNNDINLSITSNEFDNSIGTFKSYAILQSNPVSSLGGGTCNIINNSIDSYGHGIIVRNQDLPRIEENTITDVFADPNYLTEGINIENCFGAEVNCNSIVGMPTPNALSYYSIAGVRSLCCIEHKVQNNYIGDVGRAVQANAMQQGSKILANTFNDCPVGVFLAGNGVIGPQHDAYLTPPNAKNLRPQDNEYIGIGPNYPNTYYTFVDNSDGNLSPFYYRDPVSNPYHDMDMLYSGVANFGIAVQYFGVTFNGPELELPCSASVFTTNSAPENPNSALEDEEALAIMLDTISIDMTDPDEASRYWLEQQALYLELLNDTTDFTSNQNLMTFFNASSQSELEEIENIDSLVRVFYETGTLQAGVNGNNIWDLWTASEYPVQNYELFYDIYFSNITERDSFFVFDDVEISQLIQLAELCPGYHGRAVINARAVLDLIDTVDYTPNNCEFAFNPTGRNSLFGLEEDVEVSVYPNPASDFINVLKSSEVEESIKITISDANGKIVLEEEISENDYFKPLDIRELSDGVYFVRLVGTSVNLVEEFVKQ